MFWYTNVRKRKRKTVFLLILLCFLSSSLFAQNFIQDNKSKDITTEESTFDNEILKELKISSYSQTFENSGEDINITLHQSYVNNSFDTIVNTSKVNGNNFTLPSPTDPLFNSSYTRFEIEDIVAPNKSYTIENDFSSRIIQSINYHYLSFISKGWGFLENFSLYVNETNAGATTQLGVYLYAAKNVGGDPRPDDNPLYLSPIVDIEIDGEPAYQLNITGLHKFINSSETFQDTFFLEVYKSFGAGNTNIDLFGVLDNGDPDDHLVLDTPTHVYTIPVLGNTVDAFMEIGISPFNYTAHPSFIGLEINGTSVQGYSNINGSGYWESFDVNYSISGNLKFNVSADWWDVECNISQVQINYTKTNLQAGSTFAISDSGQDVAWNVTRNGGLNYFDTDFSDYRINFTIPDTWNKSKIQVFNGTDEWTVTNRTLGNGYRDVEVVNAINGTFWFLNATSSNLLISIDTYVEGVPIDDIANFTNKVRFYANYTKLIINGTVNLTVYSPTPNYLNHSALLDISTQTSNTEFNVTDWYITDNATEYGVFVTRMAWNNGTEAGFLIGNLTILGETELTFDPLPSTFDTSDIFNITVFFNDTGYTGTPTKNISDATISYKINTGNYRTTNITILGDGEYNITIDCNDTGFVNYGLNNITINASKQYYNNQSETIGITILGETYLNRSFPITPLTSFNSSEIFNITLYFNDTVKNKGIGGATEYNNTYVNGTLYTPLDYYDYGDGNYNITINCSADIFDSKGYGYFNLSFDVNKTYYHNQSDSFIIKITGETGLTISKWPDKLFYYSDEIFNITAYFNDTSRNQGINQSLITVEVDGGLYLNSSVNTARIIDLQDGYYNITINCSDSIFDSYGEFNLKINASRQNYYYGEIFNISIIRGNTTLDILNPPSDPKPEYESDQTFNITIEYVDKVTTDGIAGAMINYSISGYDPLWENVTDNLDGTYNITIYLSHPNFTTYGNIDIIINASKQKYNNLSRTLTINRIVTTIISSTDDSDLGQITRGLNATYTFNYNDTIGNPINDSSWDRISSNYNFNPFLENKGNGAYTMHLNTSSVNVGSYNFRFNISAPGNATQIITLTITVSPTTPAISIVSSDSTLARHTGANQTVRFSYTDIIKSQGISSLTTTNIRVYDETGENSTLWQRGTTDHNWTLVNLGGGVYDLRISTYDLTVGNYTLIFQIINLANYANAESQEITFYLRGYYTTFGLISLSDEGGQLLDLDNSSIYNYSSYINNDFEIRFNLTNNDLGGLVLDDMDSYYITYIDQNNNSIIGLINNTISYYRVNVTYGYFIGNLNLTQANLTTGYFQFTILITKTNYESVTFIFYLTLLPKYSVSVSIDSYLDDIIAGDNFWIAFNVSIILNSPTEPLEGALVTLTPIIKGISINSITETTNSSGIVVFEFTLPSNTQNLSLSLTLEGEFNYESMLKLFSDFTVKPPRSAGISFEVILTYLVIFGIAISAAGGSLAVYKGVIVPKKREKARILMEVKTTFDDAINLEHILILYKGTGVCTFFKSFGSEQIDPELISGFISAICSFGKDLVMQEELNEVTYGEKMLLLSDGEFIRVALVLGKKASILLRENLMEFINVFEKTYANELPNWRGQLNIFRSAGTIIDEILSTSIILPHEISYEFSNMKALKKPHSKKILDIAKNLLKETERNFLFITTLLEKSVEITGQKIELIFMGIKELRDQRILKPIEISAIEAPPISQQERNLIEQKVSGLLNMSLEENQKLINDLAQKGPAEREAYFSSIAEQREIVSAPLETKPGATGIDNIKKAKKEIKKLRKNAFSAKKKKDYENSIKLFQNAAKLAADWELSRECQELDDIIRMTKIEDFKIKKVNLEKEAKLAEKAEKYDEAAQKYKASSKTASEIFKLGGTDMTKEVKRLTNKFRECEKLHLEKNEN